MLYGKYRFFCQLDKEAILPSYKGSTFRGVFGRALKKVVCALKRQTCDQCLLKRQCVYSLVFETSDSGLPVKSSRIASQPHPFVIEPPLTEDINFPMGSSFDFNLLLFGDVNNSFPYFIYAFDQMGKIGIGKKVNGSRGTFSLKSVKNGRRIIYSDKNRKLNATDIYQNLTLQDSMEKHEKVFSLKVTIETPLRLKYENKLTAELPFHILVRAMLRRVSSLFEYYDDGEPELDYRGLVKKAKEVSIVNSKLKWFDWRRYSFKQDKAMLMGGISGSVIYKGKVSEFMPLLDFCSNVHIGKQTSFGLGQIKAELLT